MNAKEKKQIRSVKIVGWSFGIFFMILGTLASDVMLNVASLLFLFVGVLIIPSLMALHIKLDNIERRLKNNGSTRKNRGAK